MCHQMIAQNIEKARKIGSLYWFIVTAIDS